MTDDELQLPTECAECGMPIQRGRNTSMDLETGRSFDSGGYEFYQCAGLLGRGPGSPACKEIAAMRPVVEAVLAWDGNPDGGAIIKALGEQYREASNG